MLLSSLFKNNRVGGILLITLLSILSYGALIFQAEPLTVWNEMPIFNQLFDTLSSNRILYISISVLLNTLLIIILNRINVKHYLLEERSFMPASLFILCSAAFLPSLLFNPYLLNAFILILIINQIIDRHEANKNKYLLFNTSLLLLFGSLFYLRLIYYIPFLWISVSLFRPLQWREYIYPILSVTIFVFLYLSYYWLVHDDIYIFHSLISEQLQLHAFDIKLHTNIWPSAAFILLLTIIASAFMVRKIQGRKIIIRKIYQVFLIFFIYTLFLILFIFPDHFESLVMLAMPLAYLFANFFHRKRKHWSRELLLWIWILVLVYQIAF